MKSQDKSLIPIILQGFSKKMVMSTKMTSQKDFSMGRVGVAKSSNGTRFRSKHNGICCVKKGKT
jgi:hypothetical protein